MIITLVGLGISLNTKCFRSRISSICLAINVALVIAGSIYTHKVSQIDAQAKAVAHAKIVNGNLNGGGATVTAGVVVNVDNAELTHHRPAKFMCKRLPIIDRFFSCFSMSKNSSIITTDYLGSDSIEVIHGMR